MLDILYFLSRFDKWQQEFFMDGDLLSPQVLQTGLRFFPDIFQTLHGIIIDPLGICRDILRPVKVFLGIEPFFDTISPGEQRGSTNENWNEWQWHGVPPC